MKLLIRYNSIARSYGKWIFTNSNILYRSSIKEHQEKMKTYIEPIENKHFQHFTLLILIISLKKLLIEKFLIR